MSSIDYEKVRNEMGLAASPTFQGIAGSDNCFGFGDFTAIQGMNSVPETSKLRCSNKTVGYSSLHVSNTTKA